MNLLRRYLSISTIFCALIFAAVAEGQVCVGFTAGVAATCTNATAANINVNNATAGTLATGRGGTGLTTFTAAGGIPYSTSASVLSILPISTNGYFLQLVGGLPAWSQTLAAVNGGTGLNSFTQGGVFYGATTTTIANTATNTAGYLLQLNGTSAPTAVNPATLSTGAIVLAGQTIWGTPVVGQWGYLTGNNTLTKTIATSCAAAQGVGVYQGVAGTVQTDGPQLMFFDASLTLAAGNSVFLSAANDGQVTNVAPSTAGHCAAFVGYLVTAAGYNSGTGSALMVATQHGILQQL